jgi:DNA-binding transcriptional regulator YbjK
MPPFNAARRDRLADAAIDLLAREGARGLTHRAVDSAAGEPAGTTSRYFRTRDALMRGVVERVRDLHFADLARAPRGPVDPEAIADHLAGMAYHAITTDQARHLAITELFLEGTRRPGLRAALSATRIAQIQLMRDIHRAAGVNLSGEQAAALVTAITGLIMIALTTPEAIAMRAPEEIRDQVHALVRLVGAAPAAA